MEDEELDLNGMLNVIKDDDSLAELDIDAAPGVRSTLSLQLIVVCHDRHLNLWPSSM